MAYDRRHPRFNTLLLFLSSHWKFVTLSSQTGRGLLTDGYIKRPKFQRTIYQRYYTMFSSTFSTITQSTLLIVSLFGVGAMAVDAPITSCLANSASLTALADCFDAFTVPEQFYDQPKYDAAQPQGTERDDLRTVVTSLLGVDGDCSTIPIPTSLQSIYTISHFLNYCILHETSVPSGSYAKGWGYIVIPILQSQVSRNVHLSAPHPGYDGGTPQQAAAIFQATASRSLVVAGRTRDAFLQSSSCIPPVSASDPYYTTDPAHNNVGFVL